MSLSLNDSGASGGWNQGVTVSITVPADSNPYLVVMLQRTNGFQSIKYNGVDFPVVESYLAGGIIACRMCGIVPDAGTHDLVIVDTGGSGEQGHLIWALLTGVSPTTPTGAKANTDGAGNVTTNITLQFNNSITIEGQFLNSDPYTTNVVQGSGQTELQQIISSPRGLASAYKAQGVAGTVSLNCSVTRVPPADIPIRQVVWEIVDINEVGGGDLLDLF